ncbi:MAG: polymer-forming cytoskeletal protein [Cytophagales bacterium]|nr:polymer-forming cytoskeletal protein [Cytophagales bacterium]
MFSNKRAKTEAEEISQSSNIIGKGTLIEGNIETVANIRIEGKVIGNIKSKSKLVLSDTSYVEGNIQAQNAEVSGEVKGTVEVSELLVFKSTAIVKGDIITSKLAIESGANFNGTTKMGAIVKEISLSENVSSRKEKSA